MNKKVLTGYVYMWHVDVINTQFFLIAFAHRIKHALVSKVALCLDASWYTVYCMDTQCST